MEYFAERVIDYLNGLPDPDFSNVKDSGNAEVKTQENKKVYWQFITHSELYTKDLALYNLIKDSFSAVKKNKSKFS